MKKIKILLLSGGSLVGRNLLDVWEDRRGDFYLIATNSLADEPSLFEYDEVLISPSLAASPIEFEVFFQQIMEKYRPDWVIPCRDEDVLFLSKHRNCSNSGDKNRFLAGPERIASAFLDKWKSYEMSQAVGLPYAKTIQANSTVEELHRFAQEVGFPVLAKPKKGFASQGVFLIFEESQLDSLIGQDNYILQEYLGKANQIEAYLARVKTHGVPLFHSFEEVKVSIQASIGPDGEMGGLIVTSHLMKQGISSRVELCLDEMITSRASEWVAILVAYGWVGPLNIQCQLDQKGDLTIYEFNGRFTGATSGRYLMGFDELGNLLSLWRGVPLANPFDKTAQISVKRIPKSRQALPEQVVALAAGKVWRKVQLSTEEAPIDDFI